MIKTVIIDDEEVLANELKRMVESYHSDVKVAAICSNIQEAEEALNKLHPDLVFMDIELGKGQTSFDLLKRISNINFEIIFTTGYDQYSIQAIKLSALDFLLKPIDEMELKTAIEKYRNINFKVDANKIENFLIAWSNPGNQQNKMTLPAMHGYDLITIADIIYCEGVSNQTMLVQTNDNKTIISMTLKECEDILTPYKFFRIHKSHLINLNHVKKYIKIKDGIAVMSNNANLVVSNSFKDKFIEKLKI